MISNRNAATAALPVEMARQKNVMQSHKYFRNFAAVPCSSKISQ